MKLQALQCRRLSTHFQLVSRTFVLLQFRNLHLAELPRRRPPNKGPWCLPPISLPDHCNRPPHNIPYGRDLPTPPPPIPEPPLPPTIPPLDPPEPPPVRCLGIAKLRN